MTSAIHSRFTIHGLSSSNIAFPALLGEMASMLWLVIMRAKPHAFGGG